MSEVQTVFNCTISFTMRLHVMQRMVLASCLIYARAFIEYVCGCVLFQYVTVREIHRR